MARLLQDAEPGKVAVLARGLSWWVWLSFVVPISFVVIGGGLPFTVTLISIEGDVIEAEPCIITADYEVNLREGPGTPPGWVAWLWRWGTRTRT